MSKKHLKVHVQSRTSDLPCQIPQLPYNSIFSNSFSPNAWPHPWNSHPWLYPSLEFHTQSVGRSGNTVRKRILLLPIPSAIPWSCLGYWNWWLVSYFLCCSYNLFLSHNQDDSMKAQSPGREWPQSGTLSIDQSYHETYQVLQCGLTLQPTLNLSAATQTWCCVISDHTVLRCVAASPHLPTAPSDWFNKGLNNQQLGRRG